MQYILKAYSVKTIGHVNKNMQKTLKIFLPIFTTCPPKYITSVCLCSVCYDAIQPISLV